MDQLQHHPHKQDFQVERLIFFSDAVFAIAITILVIDLKVPVVPESATEQDFLNEFAKQIPQIIGFVLSFFIIGIYWTAHHNLFGYVINYTKKLLWINLVFLFTIVIMPFTTAIYSEYSVTEGHLKLISPYAIYVFNVCFSGIMNFILLTYVTNPKNKITEFVPENYVKYGKIRSLVTPVIFLISLLVCLLSPGIGRMILFLIPFAMAYIGRKIRKSNLIATTISTKKQKKE
ncbi:DUF1211 domain-containing protein [Kaistella sp. G5-32]|uniref:DUF1211 domain-containing protein n=1 Tax=Kaistella gelatinilytica TaxID=2787636 RepID=A0ABS0FBF8_9FLAO|nr:TMEM175 family protein [Kaistella gelatinilytica]MBF8457053.1 DUF1211 domain-containing protein [Kaistella gelatinilytica]